MRCPHSSAIGADPAQCSLCLGATPKKIVFDEVLGLLMCDGEPIQRFSANLGAANVSKAPFYARRTKTCSGCGKPGHTRPKCDNPASNAEDLL